MGERHDPEQLNAEDWGHAVATSEFDHDIPEDPAEEWLGSWINLLK